MKKLSIRSLLIVILALVLVFALVACGDKDKGNNNPTPTPKPSTKDTTNVKAFFNTLWDKSTGIGDEAIGKNDDLKVSVGLTVKLDFVDSSNNVQDTVDVGILLDLVLDRSSGTDKSTNTAIKAKIYDPSASENWFTAYFFFNDVDNIYIDYAGQNVKIPFSYLNDTYNAKFYNFIFNDKVIGKDDKDATKGKTIADIITALTESMGKNWDLNALVGDVMTVFGINKTELKDKIGGVFEILGLSVDEAFDAQGNINIKNVLTNETVAGFFVNDNTTSTTNGDVTTYTTQLSPSVIELINSLKSTIGLPDGIGDLLDGLKLYLEFTTKKDTITNKDAIDSFTIRANIPSLEGENANGVDVYPIVAITITDLNFAKATEGEIEKSMAVARDNYSTDVVLDAAVEIDLKGITLDATALDQENYKRFSNVNKALNGKLENLKLDGTLALTLNGKLDLANATEDGTVAAAALTYKAAGATTAVDIVKASFKNGNLALTVNQEAKVGDVGIVDVLVRLFGDYAYTWIRDTFFADDATTDAAATESELDKFADKFFSCDIKAQVEKDSEGNYVIDPQDRVITINPEFKGAVWKNFDIVDAFQDLVDDIINSEEEEVSEDNSASAQYANDPIITRVSETIVKVLPLLSTTGDKLTIKTNTSATMKNNYGTVGSAINYIGQTWWEKKAPSFIDSIIKADKDNWLGHISKALTVAGCEYNKITAAPLVTDEELAAAKANEPNAGLVTDKDLEDAKANEPNAGLVTDKELEDAKALDANAGKTDEALKAELQAAKDAKLTERLQAEKDLALRKKLQKAKDEARSKAFLNEMFASTAEVVLDISGANGLELSVKVDVNDKAGVGVSVKLGAKAYDAAKYTDLTPAANKEAGWYIYTVPAQQA